MFKTILWFQVLTLAFLGLVAGESAWTAMPGVQFEGLTKLSEIRLDMCLQICIYKEWCNLVSFDTQATLPCSIQASPGEVEKMEETKYSVTSYLLDRLKLASGEICWKAVHNKIAKGLVPFTNSELYLGLLYCVGIETCEALVYDPKSTPSCYYHMGLSGSVKEENLIPMEGAATYLLDRSCLLPKGVKVDRVGHEVENAAPKLLEKPEKPKNNTILGL